MIESSFLQSLLHDLTLVGVAGECSPASFLSVIFSLSLVVLEASYSFATVNVCYLSLISALKIHNTGSVRGPHDWLTIMISGAESSCRAC